MVACLVVTLIAQYGSLFKHELIQLLSKKGSQELEFLELDSVESSKPINADLVNKVVDELILNQFISGTKNLTLSKSTTEKTDEEI